MWITAGVLRVCIAHVCMYVCRMRGLMLLITAGVLRVCIAHVCMYVCMYVCIVVGCVGS
jgi:hypothetical protein